MATKTHSMGSIEFQGQTIEFGKPRLFDGRQGTPFMAFVFDGITADGFQAEPYTVLRVKWPDTYMPSDFYDYDGKRVEIGAAA